RAGDAKQLCLRSVGCGCRHGRSAHRPATSDCAFQDQRPVCCARRSGCRRGLSWHGKILDSFSVVDRAGFVFLFSTAIAAGLGWQTAVDTPQKAEEKQKQQNAVAKAQEKKAQTTSNVEFTGQQQFKEKDLRSAVKEQLATVDQYGLTSARADDLAFFVE